MQGSVVDETKNMFAIESHGLVKKFPKKGNEFMFTLPDGNKVNIEGSKILARPEDRIKIKVKKW